MLRCLAHVINLARLTRNPNIIILQALKNICQLPQDITTIKLGLFEQYLLRYVMFDQFLMC